MTTTVIFGDVHGESKKLRSLVAEAKSRWSDVAFYGVGDFIDRGPDSKGVIQTCLDEGIQGILGNHELWFHQLLNTGRFDRNALHPVMGGVATLDSYNIIEPTGLDGVPTSHRRFILELPLFRSVEVAGVTYWLTHAGISPLVGEAVWKAVRALMTKQGLTPEDFPERIIPEAVAQQDPDEILWLHVKARDPNIYVFPHGGVQVFGHTPLKEPLDGGHFIALDTGCGRKRNPNSLSAVALHEDGTRTLFLVG